MYGCWTDQRLLKIVNDYLDALDKMTNSEILAAFEKAKEDSRDSWMLDGEDDE